MSKAEEMYREILDEHGVVKIGTLTFYPSDILKEMDPIAYDMGLSEFEDYLEEED